MSPRALEQGRGRGRVRCRGSIRSAPARVAVATLLPTILLFAGGSGDPLQGQHPYGNAVTMIGAGASMGAGAGLLIKFYSWIADTGDGGDGNEIPWWYVAPTLVGTAVGTVVHLAFPDAPSVSGDVATSAALGAIGGLWLGLAVGLMVEPDPDRSTAPIAAAVGTVSGLAAGIAGGLAQRGRVSGTATAAINARRGTAPVVSLPLPRLLPGWGEGPSLGLELVRISF